MQRGVVGWEVNVVTWSCGETRTPGVGIGPSHHYCRSLPESREPVVVVVVYSITIHLSLRAVTASHLALSAGTEVVVVSVQVAVPPLVIDCWRDLYLGFGLALGRDPSSYNTSSIIP